MSQEKQEEPSSNIVERFRYISIKIPELRLAGRYQSSNKRCLIGPEQRAIADVLTLLMQDRIYQYNLDTYNS